MSLEVSGNRPVAQTLPPETQSVAPGGRVDAARPSGSDVATDATSVTAGHEAVRDEWDIVSDGAFSTGKLRGQDLLGEMEAEGRKEAQPKGYDIDLTTKFGERDALIKVCANFTKNFVDEAGIRAKIDACRAAIEGMPADDAKTEDLKGKLEQLEEKGKEVVEGRQDLCQFIPTKVRILTDKDVALKDRLQVAQEEIETARKAIRDFEYDLMRTHGKYGKAAKVQHYLIETFTPERNCILRGISNAISKLKLKIGAWLHGKKRLNQAEQVLLEPVEKQRISSSEFNEVEQNYDNFLRAVNAFAQAANAPSCAVDTTVPKGGPTPGQAASERALEPLKVAKEVLFVKCGMGIDYRQHVEETVRQTFATMKPGSSQEFVLSMVGGVCVPLVAKAGVKYEYSFKAECLDGGALKITRCHAGGVKASGGPDLGRVKAGASAEAKLGKVDGETFHSAEDAARALANDKFGALNLFFVSGSGAVIDGLFKKVGKSVLKFGNYSDQKFVLKAQEHGLLSKTDTFNFRGPNAAFLEDFSGVRGGLAARMEANVGLILQANASACAQIEAEGGKSTIYRSYYAYLTEDRIGESARIYDRIADPAATIDNVVSVSGLLSRKAESDEGRSALGKDLLAEVKGMIRREGLYTQRLLLADKDGLPSASTVCSHCRQAMVALVALQDKFKSLGLPPDESKEFNKSVDELKENLLRPRGMLMTKDQLKEGLYVNRSYEKSYTTEKFSFGAGVRALTDVTVGPAFESGPSVSTDVTLSQLKSTDRRAFRAKTRLTIDINIGGNLLGGGIVKIVQDQIRKAAGKAKVPIGEQGLAPMDIIGAVASGLRVAKDSASVAAELSGLSEEQAEAKLAEMLVKSTSQSTKLISLQIEDGRLTSVGVGCSASSSTAVSIMAGPVFIDTESKRSSKTLSDKALMKPSFDTLVAKCDAHLVLGHASEWSQFTMNADNKKAFLRMAEIAGGRVPAGDRQAPNDLKRMTDQSVRMQNDIGACSRPEQRGRLLANYNRFLLAWNGLNNYFADLGTGSIPKGDEQKVLAQMRTLLEATADHDNILESIGGYLGKLSEDEMRGFAEVAYLKDPNKQKELNDKGWVTMDWV